MIVNEDKCSGCGTCVMDCPLGAVRLKRKKAVIDTRCTECGACRRVCPEEAIFLLKDYSLNGLTREEMIYDKSKLLAMGGVHHGAAYYYLLAPLATPGMEFAVRARLLNLGLTLLFMVAAFSAARRTT